MSGEHGHGHAENPFAGQGAVLLDIGDDIGALVVAMPAAMLDVEIEIRPVGADVPGHHPHVAVVERPTAERTLPSLVFGDLVEGLLRALREGRGGRAPHGPGQGRHRHRGVLGVARTDLADGQNSSGRHTR